MLSAGFFRPKGEYFTAFTFNERPINEYILQLIITSFCQKATYTHKIPIFRINLPSLNIYYNTHPLLCL